ncbi:zinc ribbon domain-containing protein [Streptomyces sp. PSKA28]|uniref:Zinc ribbon domain-containing protein n=2 Tax=Streptomyces TaxID=1883 RepID=A0A7W0I726_9ACTN|nr:zinc ribbon domain-containing protein [Streptomyces himalayensis subsp. himalayensis]
MATYEYSCKHCGSFDVKLPMGTAPSEQVCPRCANSARRVYSSPAIAFTSPAVAGLRELEEKSRENPAVVTRVPPKDAAPRPVHPAVARLPRP